MSEDYQQLKERLVKLSDEQLIEIVKAPPGEYRQNALDIANAELKWRRVEIPDSDESVEEAPAGPYDPSALGVIQSAREAGSRNACLFAGGRCGRERLLPKKNSLWFSRTIRKSGL